MILPRNKTKIVCTIGPASATREVMEDMIHAGMDVARLNFSHGDFESHDKVIENLRKASSSAGKQVAIMADLSGPKMRIGDTFGNGSPDYLKGLSCFARGPENSFPAQSYAGYDWPRFSKLAGLYRIVFHGSSFPFQEIPITGAKMAGFTALAILGPVAISTARPTGSSGFKMNPATWFSSLTLITPSRTRASRMAVIAVPPSINLVTMGSTAMPWIRTYTRAGGHRQVWSAGEYLGSELTGSSVTALITS